jgi:hypothetical protein
MKTIKCSICHKPILPHPLSGWAGGNNAEPVSPGRCCDECDMTVVIPERIFRIELAQQEGRVPK